jgi:hypothetical protein
MPAHEEQAYCTHCGRYVLARSQRPHHLLHALITFLTLVWLPVWIIIAICGGSPLRCTQCGSTDLSRGP